MLDRVRSHEPVQHLIVDRLYSNWTFDRWGRELRTRGIRQHLDLSANDRGRRDYNGAALVDGWLHCPCLPTDLDVIPAPRPGATRQDWDDFHDAVDRREQYACERVNDLDTDGKRRWRCPARAGKVGCPHVPGTVEVAIANGLTVIPNPPQILTDANGKPYPALCGQVTVQTKADAQAKLAQPKYWGSRAWRGWFKRRTYVEGAFGNIKDPSLEGVARGKFRLQGAGAHLVLLAFACASYNVRVGRNRCERTGWPTTDHPLYQRDPDYHGFGHLTTAEAIAKDRAHTTRRARPAA